ncbi:ABC transporter ATP-binding protein [Methanomicrobium antiquum]|uniref:Molybdate/tungstate import ATP-binding protein WtpC n=1 Tax=Methanomicrobium antiquum TaxID=487686 RepID=A0AAF0FS54_9EURY|nr:ABC transporter ATP-binding protein [Methanomicrobium antiquum]WFN37499.1 ABC transporter ATP-binding protein [Methanomicrobium antiquum]
MIKISGLSKSYDKRYVLENISAEISDNSSVVITGPSGCGKSTLLRLIAGLEIPCAGTIEINKECASSKKGIIIPPYLRRIGYMFQSPALWPHMTVMENITFGIHDVSKSEAELRCSELMDILSVSALKDRYPSKISGGEARRIALARALAPRPQILLLDEPLVNLNPSLKEDMIELIIDWQKETKCTLVYVTHEEKEAEMISKTRFRIESGQFVSPD